MYHGAIKGEAMCTIGDEKDIYLKILVCVKSAPLPGSRFEPEAGSYRTDGIKFQVNEYDLFAMEEAVRVRERRGHVEIDAVTVGPPRAEEQLRKAMTLGADRGTLIDESDGPAGDPLRTARLIAAFAEGRGYDLVLCGVMSEDGQGARVGPMIAALMGLPWSTTAVKLELDEERKTAVCERELEGGRRERMELDLPALITVQSGLNTPRYGSLTNVLRVKSLDIPVLPARDLVPPGPASVELVGAAYPSRSSRCEFIEGPPEEAARALADRLREKLPSW